MSEREIRADAKLQNLPEEDLLELWKWRNPTEEGDTKMTYEEIILEVPLRFGFTVSSTSTVSGFYKWLKQWKRTRDARLRAEQAKHELLAQNPDASVEELERLGQMIFMSETVEDGNVKGFVSLMKAIAANRKLQLEERRVKLLEEKARKADEAEGIMGDQNLSEEEKSANMRALFGM
ncbi:hypothetical protein [Rubritalea sp.]|uniref:hypothetical protein n=1 Tax=Rubritalea sp. TaxID=2109375 RepID=UPI003EFA5BE9